MQCRSEYDMCREECDQVFTSKHDTYMWCVNECDRDWDYCVDSGAELDYQA